jgi:hypothetical protein
LSTHSDRHTLKKGSGSLAGNRIGVLVRLPANRVESNFTLCLPRGIANALPSVEVSSKTWRNPGKNVRIHSRGHCVCERCISPFDRWKKRNLWSRGVHEARLGRLGGWRTCPSLATALIWTRTCDALKEDIHKVKGMVRRGGIVAASSVDAFDDKFQGGMQG